MCLCLHGNMFSNTCARVYKIENILWNVFWFLMLCWGSVHYVREYFHCVLLLRPKEREFSSSPNKDTVHRQQHPSTGILTWSACEVVNLFTALLLVESLSAQFPLMSFYFRHFSITLYTCGKIVECINYIFHWKKKQICFLTLVLLRVLDILFFRKLKVRLTLYFSDSTLDGIMYLSHSSSSILFPCENFSQ